MATNKIVRIQNAVQSETSAKAPLPAHKRGRLLRAAMGCVSSLVSGLEFVMLTPFSRNQQKCIQ